jgi:hypothetical protein
MNIFHMNYPPLLNSQNTYTEQGPIIAQAIESPTIKSCVLPSKKIGDGGEERKRAIEHHLRDKRERQRRLP